MSSCVTDVPCTVCGCVCDDLSLTLQEDQIVQISPGCPLAEPWFLHAANSTVVEHAIAGQPCTYQDTVAEAAQILSTAKAPFIYGLSRSSTPGQQAAVRLADQVGAVIDTTASTCHAPSIMALQVVGESTASLGEVKQRADLVIYWGSNPLVSHPRHMERFVDCAGRFMSAGRSGRHVVVVDTEETETAKAADTFIQVAPGGDFELAWALRSLVRGQTFEGESIGGVPRQQIEELADRMMNCSYGALFFGLGVTRHGLPHLQVEALLRLVTDLHLHTRFIARRMRIPGDVAGADSVLCWQTGYPFSVSLGRPYPRYNPGEFSANGLLERRDVDAVILVGSEGVSKLTSVAQATLSQLPTIVLDYPGRECPFTPSVQITTAIYGIHRHGTAYRMDETPIPLPQLLPSELPADHDVLNDIGAALAGND